ncbi:putative protein phosphatase 2C 21 [Dichanthelium oligosanthes]|uniref:protein-serine/threonine phosphatase n=1 Tax=Dichanthelium oligosanthes TaxID=888268 RepID=A0A1E5VPH4_9POAL|nr:putative protein phosphatase 2C 21 [Dichanthelium oligosanthes]
MVTSVGLPSSSVSSALAQWRMSAAIGKQNVAMGASNSRGIETSTTTEVGENVRIKYAAASMQGFGEKMEDAYAVFPDLDDTTSFFGVYAGHGGAEVALLCARLFHIELQAHPNYQSNLINAIRSVFSRMDELLQQSNEWRELVNPPDDSRNWIQRLLTVTCLIVNPWHRKRETPYIPPQSTGSTVCVAVTRGNWIIVGNVGDSHCVASRNGQVNDLFHVKSHDQYERNRIERAGGKIDTDMHVVIEAAEVSGLSLVRGILRTTRSIGDFVFKQNKNFLPEAQIVICNPDIRPGETDLLVICERLLRHVLPTPLDTTVILIQFKHDSATDDAEESENNDNQEIKSADRDSPEINAVSTHFISSLVFRHVETSTTEGGENVRIKYAAASVQGQKTIMDNASNLSNAMRSVFSRMDEMLQQSNEWRELVTPTASRNWIKRLINAVILDPWCCKWGTPYVPPQNMGSSVSVAVARGNRVTIANVGDSRCVASRNGDFVFKQNKNFPPEEQLVICNPDIRSMEITEDVEFLVIASYGIWAYMRSQDVIDFVRKELGSGETDLRVICERLVHYVQPSRHNATAILIQFKHGAPDDAEGSEEDSDNQEIKCDASDEQEIKSDDASDQQQPFLPDRATISRALEFMASPKPAQCPVPVLATSNAGDLPLDIMYEILLCLPAKVLCRLRTVCRFWQSLLSDPEFAATHAARHQEPPLIIACYNGYPSEFSLVNIMDLSVKIVKQVRLDGHWVMRMPLNLAFVRSMADGGCRLVDPATAAMYHVRERKQPIDCDNGMCLFGQVASTTEYKALRKATNTHVGEYGFLYEVCTLSSGSRSQWRAVQGPPNTFGRSEETSVVIDGLVYFLTAELSLANLNGSLVIIHGPSPNMDIWFLMDFEKGLWVKQYSIQIE